MWKPAASCLVGGLFPPFDSVYKANTLYLCASIAFMFCVDLLFGQGTLSNCLSGTCNLVFWVSGQLVGNTVGTYEPWSMLGSAGGVWPLRHLVCKQCGTIFCFKTGLSGCWLDPFRPRTAGWGECYTKRGSAGCTLCLSPSAPGNVWDLPSALAVNHCWYCHSTWFMEEQGVFLWLSDVWKFQCVAHRSEKLDTLFLRLGSNREPLSTILCWATEVVTWVVSPDEFQCMWG